MPAKEISPPPRRPGAAALERWNRKLHMYAGLAQLFFIWLFAVTGLVLNHPNWRFAESWTNRKDTSSERAIAPLGPEMRGDLAQAREIMRQLAIAGEILWTTTRTDPNQFEFQVRRPGHYYFIKADLARNRVTLRQAEVNLWGVAKVLHTFTGVQMDDPRDTRIWGWTSIWVLSMDAVAAGLIFMVLSGIYIWFATHRNRLAGLAALGLGTLVCALFCIGLRWLF